MDIEQRIYNTIDKLRIPQNLREDAIQEGWLAYYGGESIIKHLKCWLAKEIIHSRHECPTDPRLLNNFESPDRGLSDNTYQGICREEDQ